jgi:hypothetical protein
VKIEDIKIGVFMDYVKTSNWLSERNIILEDSFYSTLKNYVIEYKKKVCIYT